MYDLSDLHTFVEVMNSSSLTASAKRLGVAKSTLSRRIATLESNLGQPLLRRQGNRLLPTEAGNLFLTYARDLLSVADQSRLALDDLRAEVSGELVIKVHSALGRGWMAREAERFLALHPHIRIELHQLQAPPSAPDAHAVHVWLGHTLDCGLRQETLGSLTRHLYAHPDYLARHGPIDHPSELVRHAWIDLLGDAETGMTLTHATEGDFVLQPPRSRLRVDQLVLHSDAIVRGQGLGLMPDWLAERRLKAHPGSLTRCLSEWQAPAWPVTLLYPYGHLPRKVQALLTQLRRATPAAWCEKITRSERAISV